MATIPPIFAIMSKIALLEERLETANTKIEELETKVNLRDKEKLILTGKIADLEEELCKRKSQQLELRELVNLAERISEDNVIKSYYIELEHLNTIPTDKFIFSRETEKMIKETKRNKELYEMSI